MIAMRRALPAVLLLILAGCGGGGGGENGTGGAVSGKVPYLVSGPSFTIRSSPTSTGNYDVTVTIEADGPNGVMFAGLWILHETDGGNFTHLDLVKTPGTKRWTGTTNTYVPLVPGQYYIDDIVLDDGDPFTADPLGTGWYFTMPGLSTSVYYVDERITSSVSFLYYGGGLSSRSIGRFTLP
jgi:hypothetical protein